MASDVYGAEFSPNGKYIYCTTYYGDCEISQYDIANGTFTFPFSYAGGASAGGLKLGPDGKLYVKREGQYMGVIANPNAPLTSSGYTQDGFNLGVFSDGITFSTGLTPPAICPSGLNEAPIPANDSMTVFLNGPAVCLSVMRNDTDPNPGDSLNIVNVFFSDAADANKLDILFQQGDSTVCIMAKPAAQPGDVVRLIYTVRDDANPIRLCSDATVTVRFANYPDNVSEADCYVDPPASAWSFKELDRSTQAVNTLGMTHAGDIDDDGHVEILAMASSSGGYDNVSTLYAFDDNLDVKYTIDLGAGVNVISNAISIADVDKDGKAEIFACSADGYLRKYSFNGTNFVADGSVQHTTNSDYYYCQPMIADFDGNGVPEILVLDKIYDAQTLTLLVDGAMKGVSDLGLGSGHVTTYGSATNKNNSMISIGDIDNDGLPELLAGATAYKINITNTSGIAGNTFTIHKQANTTGHAEVGDGATVIADMDLDGYLDVIVSRRTTGNKAAIFIWNPRTGEVMNTNVYEDLFVYPASSNYGPWGPSVPFVGDIDGDGKPEIVVVSHNTGTTAQTSTSGRVTALDFDNGLIAEKWKIENSDYSAATGITLFDFNQDGAGELVYRDITHLHILNGIDGSPMITPIVCSSPTGAEYPIVVDYNNDGAAEIIITGGTTTGTFNPPVAGYLWAYGSAGTKWAPARKVWNQYMYNVVNINEDLTVPAIQMNPSMVFAGKDHILGTADDVRPYNNFLQQQTALSKYGTPMWLAINAQIAGNATEYYDAAGDSLTITLQIHNAGDAAIQPPFHVSAYKNEILPDSIIATDSLMAFVYPDSTAEIHVIIRNVTSLLPIDSIKIQLNDNGTTLMQQSECDYTTNVVITPLSEILMAQNDYATTLTTTPVKVNALSNDSIPNGCTPTLSVTSATLYGGTATLVNDSVQYAAAAGFVGFDIVTYSIACNGDTSTAQVVVLVLNPLSLKYIACADAVVTMGFYPPKGVTYYWYDAQTGGNLVKTEASDTIERLKNNNALQTWWVEPTFGGITFPRYRVDLELSNDCGITNPTGCAATGTVIWKEDFDNYDDGLNPASPSYSTEALAAGMTTYNFYSAPVSVEGAYALTKDAGNPADPSLAYLQNFRDDHTHPNNPDKGRFFMINGAGTHDQLYKQTVNGLCKDTKLYFSFWAKGFDALLKWRIFSSDDNSTLATFVLSELPNASQPPSWKQYGFTFSVPEGVSSVYFDIFNDCIKLGGNDFAIDDIEVRFCIPGVTLAQPTETDTTLCEGNGFELEGSYTDDGTFGNNLVYRWEHNSTADFNNPANWMPITGTEGASNTGSASSVYTVNSAAVSHSGYYRLAIANAANINNYSCRAMSDIVSVKVLETVVSGTVGADQTICHHSTPAQLTSTAATGGSVALTYQWQQSADNGSTWTNVSSGTSGTLPDYTPPSLTQTTQYRLITTGGAFPCEADTSNVVTITVLSPLAGGIIGTSSTYCYKPVTPNIHLGTNLPSGGSEVYRYQWQNSVNGNDWNDIAGDSSVSTHTISGVTQTMQYRRVVVDSLCGTAYSDTVTVYLFPSISSAETELCVRGSTPKLSPATGGTWTSSNPAIAEINDNMVTGISAGEAYLVYTLLSSSCSDSIKITVKDFPTAPEITGRSAVCIGDTIHLSNAVPNGIWTIGNYKPKVRIEDPNANPVTIHGETEGFTYVTYTVFNGVCETRKTFRLKVVPNEAPTIIIGIERK
jgi:hypothetical protein